MSRWFYGINEYMPLFVSIYFIDLINKDSKLYFEELFIFSAFTKGFRFSTFYFP